MESLEECSPLKRAQEVEIQDMDNIVENAEKVEIIEDNITKETARSQTEKKSYAKSVEETQVNMQELFKHRRYLREVRNEIIVSLAKDAFMNIKKRNCGFQHKTKRSC